MGALAGCASILGDFDVVDGTGSDAGPDVTSDAPVHREGGVDANADADAGDLDAQPDAEVDGSLEAEAGPPCGDANQICCANDQCHDSALNCFGGYCHPAANGDTGKPCVSAAGCATSICLSTGAPVSGGDGGSTGNVCTSFCADAGSCIAGWTCGTMAGVTSSVCKCQYAPEICDGLDNDCDGVIDNGQPGAGQACDTGLKGVCAKGTTACDHGAPKCVQSTGSSVEICDNQDNDCNGFVDDGDPGGGAACNTGKKGVCAPGVMHCAAGSAACVQTVASAPEVCDGIDNDCDGTADNGDPGGGAQCDTGLLGVCAYGVQHCQNASVKCVQQQAAAQQYHTSPGANGSWDWSCDGKITKQWDDGSAWPNGGGKPCTAAGYTAALCQFLRNDQCTPYSAWNTFSCSGTYADCGVALSRVRCEPLGDSCTNSGSQASSESATSGDVIPHTQGCF